MVWGVPPAGAGPFPPQLRDGRGASWLMGEAEARMEGFQAATMDECVGEFVFFASAIGNFMKKMKNMPWSTTLAASTRTSGPVPRRD